MGVELCSKRRKQSVHLLRDKIEVVVEVVANREKRESEKRIERQDAVCVYVNFSVKYRHECQRNVYERKEGIAIGNRPEHTSSMSWCKLLPTRSRETHPLLFSVSPFFFFTSHIASFSD